MQTSNAELVGALCADAAQLNALDARGLDADSADAAAVARELVVILNSTIEIFTALEQLNQPPGGNGDMFSDLEPDTRVSMRAIKVSPPKLEDVCFAGGLELNRARSAI